jgi:micrococcal nuclease
MNPRSTAFGFLFIFIVTLALLCSGCTGSQPPGDEKPQELVPGVHYHALVTNVVDGDTFDVLFPDRDTERIRILGVDTPETTPGANIEGEYGTVNDTALLAEWGARAGSYARSCLIGNEVGLEIDRGAGARDRYGRILAYVATPDGNDFGALLLQEGLARVYTAESFSRKDDYLRLEREARTERTGLWGDIPPATPCTTPDTLVSPFPGTIPDTRAPSTGPYILEVVYDPPGDDRADPNGEYIVISNAGPGGGDLTGWRVREGGGATFTFPTALVSPGSTITLHTGKGTRNGTSFYWNSTAPILNNDGDSVTLLDPSGKIAGTYSWGQ